MRIVNFAFDYDCACICLGRTNILPPSGKFCNPRGGRTRVSVRLAYRDILEDCAASSLGFASVSFDLDTLADTKSPCLSSGCVRI